MSHEPVSRLSVDGLEVSYGRVPVVYDLSLSVAAGEVVVLLGPNGAGKSSTLQAVTGVIPARGGTVRLGDTRLSGPLHRRVAAGLAYLPEGRSVIRRLSVLDNLRLGRGSVEAALAIGPELEPLLRRKAGLLSGGEQQILCLSRLLAAGPRVLLADEMSLGLAPKLVARMLAAARRAADAGTAVLLVEQHAHQALAVADRGYVMSRGRLVLAGAAQDLLADIGEIERHYLTGAEEATPVAVERSS